MTRHFGLIIDHMKLIYTLVFIDPICADFIPGNPRYCSKSKSGHAWWFPTITCVRNPETEPGTSHNRYRKLYVYLENVHSMTFYIILSNSMNIIEHPSYLLNFQAKPCLYIFLSRCFAEAFGCHSWPQLQKIPTSPVHGQDQRWTVGQRDTQKLLELSKLSKDTKN